MLGSVLIGLDGSKWSNQAAELAIRWAHGGKATLVGISVVDQPGIRQGEPVPLGGASFKEHRDDKRMQDAQRHTHEILNEFAEKCRAAGAPFKTRAEVGCPWTVITGAAQECDIVMLGMETHFRFGAEASKCDTLLKVVKQAPRPIVAVPLTESQSNITVIAYDGSLQAARALQTFQAVDLFRAHELYIVSIDGHQETADQHARTAATFLGYHEMNPTIRPIVSSAHPADVLLDQIAELNAGLLVMGAYGEPFLTEFFFGSATKRLLEKATVPIFMYH